MLVKDPPVEIADNLWMLGTNAYPLFLFKGAQRGTIFEGGTGPMGPVLREQLGELGINSGFVTQVVVTHAHPDHVMAVPMMQQMFPGVAVLASEPAAKTLAFEKAFSFFCKMDDQLTGSLIDAGMVTEEQRRPPSEENQLVVDQVLKEGDTINVDEGVGFKVLETPGHSDCSLSFHEPASGTLIVSDATGFYTPEPDYWWPNYFVDYGAYLESIKRLAELGAEVLCLSHNAVIRGAEDVAAYFRDCIAATEQYHQRIVDDAKSGKSTREIGEVLGSEVYEKTPLLPVEFFQKNCGLLAKLSLRHEGIEVEK